MNKKASLYVSVAIFILSSALMSVFQFDMYIPKIHSIISIVLNVAVCLMLSVVIYKLLTKTFKADNILLYFMILLGIAHGIYTVMFYASWVCLGIIALIFILWLIGRIQKAT